MIQFDHSIPFILTGITKTIAIIILNFLNIFHEKAILCLLITSSLTSCQQEAGTDSNQEDIFKKRTEKKLKLDEFGEGESTANKEVTVQETPFDFGLSVVLGAGALAAIRTAR